jgi:acyl-CoA thioesterase
MTAHITPEMQALWANDHAPREFGMILISAYDGHAELQVKLDQRHMNSHGIGHGGMIATLADSAAGFAANSNGGMAVTQTNAITYLTPARCGDALTAKAVPVAHSGRSAIFDVTVTAQDGRTVAILRAQMRYIPPRA